MATGQRQAKFNWRNISSWPRAMRIVLLLGVLVLTSLWCGIHYFIRSTEEGNWQKARAFSAQAARLAAKSTEIRLNEANNLVNYLKNHVEENGSLPPIAPLLSEHKNIYHIYRSFADGSVENKNGFEQLYRANFATPPNDKFKKLRVGKMTWDPFLVHWTLPVSKPVLTADGSFDGFVTVIIDGAFFSDEFYRLDLPEDAKLIIFGDDHVVRAANTPRSITSFRTRRLTAAFSTASSIARNASSSPAATRLPALTT